MVRSVCTADAERDRAALAAPYGWQAVMKVFNGGTATVGAAGRG
jgi:hypothetical protein